MLQKIGIGFVFAIAAMVVAGSANRFFSSLLMCGRGNACSAD